MNCESIHTVSVAGAGNVATRLSLSLVRSGLKVAGVWSRTYGKAERLAAMLNAEAAKLSGDGCPGTVACREPEDLAAADVAVLCVPDDALPSVAERLQGWAGGAPLVHTAGSVPMSVLRNDGGPCGVIYPLQTLTAGREMQFSRVPLFVEASDEDTAARLEALARRLSPMVQRLDGEGRKRLHLSAVFACNFPNALLGIAESLLADAGVGRQMLGPLVQETLNKFLEHGAVWSQTGPAARGDEGVMARHKAMLEGRGRELEIYKLLSAYIQERKADVI